MTTEFMQGCCIGVLLTVVSFSLLVGGFALARRQEGERTLDHERIYGKDNGR